MRSFTLRACSQMRLTLTALLVLAALGSGCAVRSTYIKPDFPRVDRLDLKRIAVMATPLADAPPRAAELLARMSRRFIHQHKDYLAVSDGVLQDASAWKQLCAPKKPASPPASQPSSQPASQPAPGLHGVVRVMVSSIKQDAEDLTVDMVVDLRRCDSGVLVWKVEIDDTNEKKDEDLSKLAEVYKEEFGPVAEKFAAPFFIVVKTAFDSLPSPKLTEEETMEKIEMD